MKDHGNENSSTEVPVRALKSLLKKPGQSKAKGHKNRVVINEKLNEFFAADYIILIKEECCTDYEEECDCCCQEHEMIRLGNCKECRAELNLHFGGDGRFGDGCEDDVQVQREQVFGSEESLGEEEEDEEENDEDDEDEPEVIGEVSLEEKRNVAPQRSQHQQRETLSPPEGYKDLCVENELGKEPEHRLENVCAECNYYQRATGESRGSYFSPCFYPCLLYLTHPTVCVSTSLLVKDPASTIEALWGSLQSSVWVTGCQNQFQLVITYTSEL